MFPIFSGEIWSAWQFDLKLPCQNFLFVKVSTFVGRVWVKFCIVKHGMEDTCLAITTNVRFLMNLLSLDLFLLNCRSNSNSAIIKLVQARIFWGIEVIRSSKSRIYEAKTVPYCRKSISKSTEFCFLTKLFQPSTQQTTQILIRIWEKILLWGLPI